MKQLGILLPPLPPPPPPPLDGMIVRYPFIHLGGERQCEAKFLLSGNDTTAKTRPRTTYLQSNALREGPLFSGGGAGMRNIEKKCLQGLKR